MRTLVRLPPPLLLLLWLQAASSTPGLRVLQQDSEYVLEQYLVEEVGLSRATVGEKVVRLVDEGYDTPALFQTLSASQLSDDFGITLPTPEAPHASSKKKSVRLEDDDEEGEDADKDWSTVGSEMGTSAADNWCRTGPESCTFTAQGRTCRPCPPADWVPAGWKEAHPAEQVAQQAGRRTCCPAVSEAASNGASGAHLNVPRTIAIMAQYLVEEVGINQEAAAREYAEKLVAEGYTSADLFEEIKLDGLSDFGFMKGHVKKVEMFREAQTDRNQPQPGTFGQLFGKKSPSRTRTCYQRTRTSTRGPWSGLRPRERSRRFFRGSGLHRYAWRPR